MRSATVYYYDAELRPGEIAVDFESHNKNEEYLLRYSPTIFPEDAAKMAADILKWLSGENPI